MRVKKDGQDFKIHAIVVKKGDHLWHVVELAGGGIIILTCAWWQLHMIGQQYDEHGMKL